MKKWLCFLLAFLVFCCLGFVLADRYSWEFHHRMEIMKKISVTQMSLYWRGDSRSITFRSRNMNITGSLWIPETGHENPGIIMLHGSTPFGRKLELYPLLAHFLSQRGYVVLCIDLPGFGESDDPPDLSAWPLLNDTATVMDAVSYMEGLPQVDKNRINLVGHSLGGGIAMKTATADRRIRKVIAIGPPRRLTERTEKEFESFRQRYSRDRCLAGLVPPDVFSEFIHHMALENFIPWFSSDGHQPVLLIDGSQEDKADLQYLKGYYEKLTPPKKYVTVPNTAHYLSVADFRGFNPVIYDRTVIGEVIDLMDTWLKEE